MARLGHDGPHHRAAFAKRRVFATHSNLLRLIALYTVAFLGIGALTEVPRAPGQGVAMSPAHFVGSEACANCHATQHTQWMTSQHHAAMQEATEKTVLGDFNGANFTKDGVETTFFTKDGKFWVRTDGLDGALRDFEIRYTFGVWPLQQYLIELSSGRLQALTIAWDARPKESGGQRWYTLYPNRKIHAGDPLHWTGIDQNWNYQCAYCHSTNLEKGFNSDSGAFQTKWAEISVGCEACHGPGSEHLAWAAQNSSQSGQVADPAKGLVRNFDERHGVMWAMGAGGQATRSAPRTTSREIEVCATCHSRRGQFANNAKSARLDDKGL